MVVPWKTIDLEEVSLVSKFHILSKIPENYVERIDLLLGLSNVIGFVNFFLDGLFAPTFFGHISEETPLVAGMKRTRIVYMVSDLTMSVAFDSMRKWESADKRVPLCLKHSV